MPQVSEFLAVMLDLSTRLHASRDNVRLTESNEEWTLVFARQGFRTVRPDFGQIGRPHVEELDEFAST